MTKKENRNYIITVLILVIVLFIGGNYAYNHRTEIKEAGKIPVKVIKSDKTELDTIIDKLSPILIKREGLTLKEYTDGKFTYIYYGHLIKRGEKFNYTSKQADSVLRADIIAAYNENKRIYKRDLLPNVKSIFISGKPLKHN